MDTNMDTSVEANEANPAPHHRGPNESAAPTLQVPAAAASRATITTFFSEISPLTGPGTSDIVRYSYRAPSSD